MPKTDRIAGELEPDFDGDFWADHDENCHGPIDTDEMREENPDGFVWSCCNEIGSAKGCMLGRHASDPHKAARYESNSGAGSSAASGSDEGSEGSQTEDGGSDAEGNGDDGDDDQDEDDEGDDDEENEEDDQEE